MKKMNAKNLLVSFITAAIILMSFASVSATNYDVTTVKVDGIDVDVDVDYTDLSFEDLVALNNPVLIAGETVTVKVSFTSDFEDKDVTVTATIDTGKEKVEAETSSFRVAENAPYKKILTLKVPYELKDELSDTATLEIEIEGTDFDYSESYELIIERVQYDTTVKSLNLPSSIDAGETFAIDFVIKNTGYYNLDDMYVTAYIPALGIQKTVYLDEIFALDGERTSSTNCRWETIDTEYAFVCDWVSEGDEDDEDTLSGQIFLKVPYDVEAGLYALEFEVTNDDTSESVVSQLVIENDFPSNVVVTNLRKTVAVGEDAEFNLLIVNPTDKLVVYRIISESTGDLSSNADETVVAVQAGSSKTVTITANADSEGEYDFEVNVFSVNEIVDTVTLSLNVEGNSVTNPIVILTVVLAIIFLVLLVVLIVLITKKPEKTEEFGESYY